MKASTFYSKWIMIKSALLTAYYSLFLLVRLPGKPLTRQYVDHKIQIWVNHILNAAKATYTVVNPHQVVPKTSKKTIIMSNHSSLYDIPLAFKVFPQHTIRMLAKKELAKIPFMGQAMIAAEFPFIDRKNRTQAFKDLERTKQLMESGAVIWIYPEGTRSKNGRVAPFKKGAFITAIEAQATIIPVGIRGAFDILPPHSNQLNLKQNAELHVGEPIDASEFTLENKEVLIAKVHQAIQTLVNRGF